MSDKPPIPASLEAELRAEFERAWRQELRRTIPVKDRMRIGRRAMPQRPRSSTGVRVKSPRPPKKQSRPYCHLGSRRASQERGLFQ